MNESTPPDELEFRVGLLERAIAESSTRVDELTKALARLGGAEPSGQERIEQIIEINADSIAPFAMGFHAREVDASGRPYRWTGSSDFFELRFSINRNLRWTFEMDLATNSNVDLNLLRAFVDYAEIPVELKQPGHVLGCLPIRPFSNLAALTFYLPSRFVPKRLDPSAEDNRSLSVVFYKIVLKPTNGGTVADASLPHAE